MMEGQSLLMEMEVVEGKISNQYKLRLQNNHIPTKLQRYIPKIQDVFSLMGREDNLIVRPIEGKIDLILPSAGNSLSKHTL